MESLKILMNAPSVRIGESVAQSIHQREFVKNLVSMGHEVHLIAQTTGEEERDVYSVFSGDIPLARLFFGIDDYFAVKKLIKKTGPDIIHDRGYIFGGTASFIAGKKNIPSIIQIDDDWILSESMSSKIASTRPYVRIAEWWTKSMLSSSDYGFTVSTALKNTFSRRYGIPEDKMGVVPNGVDTDAFSPDVEPLGLRERYDINGTLVMFIGALGPWHGIDNLMSAMRLLGDRDITCVVIGGKKDDIVRFRDVAKSMHIDENIVFTGSLPHREIPHALVEADIAIAPYPNTEFGFSPFKILEYMASGRAIITSDLPSIKELLGNEEAMLARSWKPRELARAISELSKDDGRRKEMGRKARKKVVENFTWRKSTETLVEMYYKIMDR